MPTHHPHHHSAPSHSDVEHHDRHHGHDDSQAQILELDAEVMAEHIAAVIAWLPVRSSPMEILDLGAGTGAGSFALLSQFPEAHLTAVDSSAAHLDQLRTKASAANLSDRVRIVHADLDASAWPDLGVPDLVWAAGSLHHLADPERSLRKVHDFLATDGLLAVLELAGLPRFLPPDAPEERPGLEERVHAPTQHLLAEQLPHRGSDWGVKLAAAGFTVPDSLTIDVNVSSSDNDTVGPYALAALERLRMTLDNAVADDDLAALDQLLDTASPHSILRRHDLAVRTTRTVWVARRGGDPATTPN